jgi:threonine 3-dehydrogenase
MVTHEMPVEQFQQGFDIMCSGQSGKVILNWS